MIKRVCNKKFYTFSSRESFRLLVDEMNKKFK